MNISESDAELGIFQLPLMRESAPIIRGGVCNCIVDAVTSTFCFEDQDFAEEGRDGRKYEANDFRCSFRYGSSLEKKTFVGPGGTHQWEDESSGTIWIGVHGMDSICVVTRTGDLDLTRVRRDLKYLTIETVLRKFRKTVISEIEDLASPSSKLCEQFGPSIPKPFGVVSVILPTDNDHEESGQEASSDEYEEVEEDEGSNQVSSAEYESNEERMAKLRKAFLKDEKREQNNWPDIFGTLIADQWAEIGCDEKKTIKFIREEMRKDATLSISNQGSSTKYDESEATAFLLEKMKTMTVEAFTVDETIKIAISAFQHLFQKEFKANEIEVTVMDPRYFGPMKEVDEYIDTYVKELETSEIKKHLDAINGLGSACWCNGLFLIRWLLGWRPGCPIWK